MKFYLQFLCLAGYLKHCNDTPKLDIQKYTNYNIIEIYSDGLLDNDVREAPLL